MVAVIVHLRTCHLAFRVQIASDIGIRNIITAVHFRQVIRIYEQVLCFIYRSPMIVITPDAFSFIGFIRTVFV